MKQSEAISVTVPASKSISNRLLILQKTCGIPFIINNLSTAHDTKLLNSLLNCIENNASNGAYLKKITQRTTENTQEIIENIHCENCGTAYRFLTAYLSCLSGKWLLDGSERMRNRPIKPLTDTLIRAGADISYIGKLGFPPLQINGGQLTATYWEIDARQSSQYVSAIAMILPLIGRNSELFFLTDGNSMQYIDMTIKLMQQLGRDINRTENKITYVENNDCSFPPLLDSAEEIFVEYDWSSAAVWFAFSALSSQKVINIQGLKKSELQADSIISEWIKPFGVQTNYTENGVELINTNQQSNQEIMQFDCRNNPDLVPCIASLCVGLRQKTVLKNVQNLALKESNRIEALVQELGKIARLNHENNDLIIIPKQENFPTKIYFSSHTDHRMVMSLSLLSTRIQDVIIDDTACVNKSYPEFDVFSRCC